ncbi:MAG TPA: SGNH/GDSL hydrolase family protein [Intrasporangiaceae bacterium]|nr:SGNH/GDSL hydrolase family protein [Intrasporangiaceae bacterium]
MGRAARARRIASAAAYGGGRLAAVAGALGAAGYGLIRAEAQIARHLIGQPFDSSPDDNGSYGHGPGDPLELLILGDSSAAGLGADEPSQTIGAILATGVAAISGRRVRLTNVAVVGAESSALDPQVSEALDRVPAPDVAVILVGANDVTHRIDQATAVRHLEQAVRRLLDAHCHVVVGTCPDLGTIEPVPQPLRWLARRWSRDLAAAQTVAVVEAGGRTVSLADMLGPEFAATPKELFSTDRFHPSAAGYARAAAALLPSVIDALGLWAGEAPPSVPRPVSRRNVAPVSVAAGVAASEPGVEVSGAELAGATRGPRGRWARLLRRRQEDIPDESRPDESDLHAHAEHDPQDAEPGESTPEQDSPDPASEPGPAPIHGNGHSAVKTTGPAE